MGSQLSGISIPRAPASRNRFANHLATDVRQAKTAPLVFECQTLMVDSHEIYERRVKIMDVHRVARDVVPKRIGFS